MRQMQPVLWTKGVLLSPQHFQTQDRFLEDLLEFQLSALAFCPWGFQRLEIDREALASGSFGLSAASGILPDGLLFDMPQSEGLPGPKPLEGAFAPDQEWLDVYLGIPEYRYGGHNVSGVNRERDARYRAEELLRRDETTGQAERPIQVARRNFRILFGGESLEGTSALRVARVTRAATGDYQLDQRFVPPLVDIGASDYLMAIARRLVEILSAKSTGLAAGRRQKNQSLAEFGVADVASFWLLYTINSFFPELRHIFETRRGHPAELYTAMLALAGALTAGALPAGAQIAAPAGWRAETFAFPLPFAPTLSMKYSAWSMLLPPVDVSLTVAVTVGGVFVGEGATLTLLVVGPVVSGSSPTA